MLQHIAARGRALRQVSRAARNHPESPFTTLTKASATTRLARHNATVRGEAEWVCRPRAMMSSNSAEPSRVSGTETYLDYTSSPDVDFDLIKSNMTCKKFHDSTWGFVTAWVRLLQALRSKIQEDLRFYIREDVLKFHDLHAIDDKTLYGATSHQVRDHFQCWVPKNLEGRLRTDAINLQDDVGWAHATSTPRYEYCLFVDDLCLESVDYPGINSPVVKLLCKQWESPFHPPDRNYTIPAPFHDGVTDHEEEDVGWMYMPLQEYLHKYDLLGKCDWDDQYVRPPYIDGTEDESEFVGHWRQESLSEEA
ncbi:hypothetical protein QQS21_005807 [Conoideocrella luteorostrata]|uniref:Uncharacterized protein n=1 Tax=Conoideocrella luteorostrata TaxID=1105319 RepID=A0AAJ0CRT7_9HYPO|nr:hypothetical protein QQS21_005807 [Conoideocrella luteorostrata]